MTTDMPISLNRIKQIIDDQISVCADDRTGRVYKLACQNIWNMIEATADASTRKGEDGARPGTTSPTNHTLIQKTMAILFREFGGSYPTDLDNDEHLVEYYKSGFPAMHTMYRDIADEIALLYSPRPSEISGNGLRVPLEILHGALLCLQSIAPDDMKPKFDEYIEVGRSALLDTPKRESEEENWKRVAKELRKRLDKYEPNVGGKNPFIEDMPEAFINQIEGDS